MTQSRRLGPGEGALWRTAVHILVASKDRDDELISETEAEAALADDRCYLLICELEGQPAGLLSAYRFPDLEAGGLLVYLYDIEVAVQQRRRSLGSQLIRLLVTLCDADDVDLIWAGTERSNTPARGLFDKQGAVLSGDAYCEYEWLLED